MATTTKIPVDQEFIRQEAARNAEPEWFTNLRLDALSKAEALELPRPDKTNISKWDLIGEVFGRSNASELKELPKEVTSLMETTENQNIFVSVNGKASTVQLSKTLQDQGVIFTDIFTAIKEHSDLVQKYFNTAVKVDENLLTALNTALVNGGLFLYVPRNVVVSEPIQAIYYTNEEKPSVVQHVLVVADDFSEVTFVENYVTGEDIKEKAVANIVTEVIVNTNAKVVFGAVDTLSEMFTTYSNRRGLVNRDGKLEWALGLMNDCNTVYENITHLKGDGSFADSKTVTVGQKKQTQNFTTSIIHWGKGSEGYILKHGVQKDEATSIFNGIGKIEHGASKSNAEQTSRVLMLSEKARGDANPILLIDEDDVTAGHAASVGKVDPLQLYYLMSRGIPKREAERLVIHGFLAPVVNELPIEEVKKQLVAVIERKVR